MRKLFLLPEWGVVWLGARLKKSSEYNRKQQMASSADFCKRKPSIVPRKFTVKQKKKPLSTPSYLLMANSLPLSYPATSTYCRSSKAIKGPSVHGSPRQWGEDRGTEKAGRKERERGTEREREDPKDVFPPHTSYTVKGTKGGFSSRV